MWSIATSYVFLSCAVIAFSQGISSNQSISISQITTSSQPISSISSTSPVQSPSTTSTTLVPAATITVTPATPCNGHVELCDRSYANITYVGAHNSPFDQFPNPASNQEYGVLAQLNDGIRMLQGQTHMWNGHLSFCHTYCELEDAGPIQDYFFNVTQWLDGNPNEVVSILLGNGDYVDVSNYIAPINNSGLIKYAYVPPKVPMALGDWPTLGELIGNNTRAVIFLDYDANQKAVPYLLDEFSHMFETPFDPTDRNFPCNVDRPPNLGPAAAKDRLYLTNHNLNVNLQVATLSVLLPDFALLPETNGVSGYGSLGLSANSCETLWQRPPNFMLVDFYNWGYPNGSVFLVAAEANGVNYTGSCCGRNSNVSSISGATRINVQGHGKVWMLIIALAVAVALVL